MRRFTKNAALKTALFYLLFGGLWIVLSDRILAVLTDSPHSLSSLQTIKGWFFICITSLLLYFYVKRLFSQKEQSIKDLEKIKQELQKSEEKYRLLIENQTDLVVKVDGKGNYVFISPSYLKVFGKTEEELIGKSFLPLIHPDDQKKTEEEMKKLLMPPYNCYVEQRALTINGWRWFAWSDNSIVSENGEISAIIGVGRDITEQKQAELELMDAKEKAVAADKIKSEFLAQMSHEIRTPINTILNAVSLIREEVEDKYDDLSELFPILNNAGARIIKTIDSILNMSELQLGIYEPHFKKIDLDIDILRYLIAEFKYSAENKKLGLNIKINTNDTEIIGDSYSITQIFTNLLDNAIKYTNKGKIDVLLSRNGNNRLVAEVCDTGIGISEDFIKKMFIPFSQEHQGYTRQYDGNGLGLALIKNYCKINKAEIKVDSKKNEGSVFRVIFNQ